MRRLWVPAVVATVLTLAVHAVGAAGPEWRSLTDGYGWPTCATVEFTIDASSLPDGTSEAQLRRDLEAGATAINVAAGRTLVAVASGVTTDGPAGDDGTNVVHFRDLAGSDDPDTIQVQGYAAASWRTYSDGSGEIVDADIILDDNDWSETPVGLRVLTLTHEFGHALGLDHVGDAHEVMSYGYRLDGDGIGPGTRQALLHLYDGTDCSTRRTLVDSHDWSGLQLNGPGVSPVRAGETAADVRSLAVEMGDRLGQRHDGGQWATHAVVCRADKYPDCLAGAPLAGTRGPLVFAPGGPDGKLSTSDTTYRFLERAVPPSAPIYVLGGDQAVSDRVFQTLQDRWPGTTRLAGPSRVETAVEVARTVVARSGTRGTVLIARSDNPADAVTGGAAAAARGLPILLTAPTVLHPAAVQALTDFGAVRSVVLGGEAALSAAVFDELAGRGHGPVRVAGRTRTETAVAVARHPELWGRTSVAAGDAFVGLSGWHDETWALALASSPLAAAMSAPVLLTGPDDVAVTPPQGSFPGDTGHYLAHLAGNGPVEMWFVGSGRWADHHARDAFWQYLGLY